MVEGTGSYLVMPHAEIGIGPFSASAVQPDHIESIRRWRNAQIRGLRQAHPITTEQQQRYFSTSVWPEKKVTEPRNVLLIYQSDGAVIGYGGLVHFSWPDKRAEVSFLLDPDHEKWGIDYAQAFATWLDIMKILAFDELRLSRLTAETYATRSENLAVLDQAGFEREGFLKGHVVVEGAPVDATLHGLNRNRFGPSQ